MAFLQNKILLATLFGKCPKCFNKTIFQNYVKLNNKCSKCQLDISKGDIGDGAIYLASFVVGAIITLLSIWLEFSYPISFYAHVLIWMPSSILMILFCLRFFKALLLGIQYIYRKSEFE